MCIFVELLVNPMTVGGHPRVCPAHGLQNFHQMMRQKVEHRFVSDTDDLFLDESGASRSGIVMCIDTRCMTVSHTMLAEWKGRLEEASRRLYSSEERERASVFSVTKKQNQAARDASKIVSSWQYEWLFLRSLSFLFSLVQRFHWAVSGIMHYLSTATAGVHADPRVSVFLHFIHGGASMF